MHISSRRQPQQVLMHGALAHTPQNRQSYNVNPEIAWDLRQSAQHARVASSHHHLPSAVRGAFATQPALRSVNITCGLFPSQDWVIHVSNPHGVTVEDILNHIHHALRKRISSKEWARLQRNQQAFVADAFHRRARMSADAQYETSQGLRRIDFLLGSTVFVGLTPSTEAPYTWTLTMKRARQ